LGGPRPSPVLLVESAAYLFALGALAFALPWHRLPRWTDLLVPLLFFVLVAWLRRQQGYGREAVSVAPLFLIPAFWVALYGTRSDLVITLTTITVVRFIPNAVTGFEPGELGYSLAALVASTTVCALTQQTVSVVRRAEATKRLSEAKFAGIISMSADAIISVDEDQRITIFNHGAEEIFGYTRKEAIGAPLDMLIPERLRATSWVAARTAWNFPPRLPSPSSTWEAGYS
jgi:PAS domain-containing protein